MKAFVIILSIILLLAGALFSYIQNRRFLGYSCLMYLIVAVLNTIAAHIGSVETIFTTNASTLALGLEIGNLGILHFRKQEEVVATNVKYYKEQSESRGQKLQEIEGLPKYCMESLLVRLCFVYGKETQVKLKSVDGAMTDDSYPHAIIFNKPIEANLYGNSPRKIHGICFWTSNDLPNLYSYNPTALLCHHFGLHCIISMDTYLCGDETDYYSLSDDNYATILHAIIEMHPEVKNDLPQYAKTILNKKQNMPWTKD